MTITEHNLYARQYQQIYSYTNHNEQFYNICTKIFPIEFEDVPIISPVSNEKIPLVGNMKCSNKN